jgi:hypothetical protein
MQRFFKQVELLFRYTLWQRDTNCRKNRKPSGKTSAKGFPSRFFFKFNHKIFPNEYKREQNIVEKNCTNAFMMFLQWGRNKKK